MYRARERGMSYWPFVVALVGLLAMTYMWYEAGSKRDDMLGEIARLKGEKASLDEKWRKERDAALRVSELVGWSSELDKITDPDRANESLRAFVQQCREQLVLKFDTEKFSATGPGGAMEKIGQGEYVVRYFTDAIPESDMTVERVLPRFMTATKRMLADIEHHVQLKAAAENGKAAAETEKATAMTQRDRTIADLQTQLRQIQAQAAEQANELRGQIAALESQNETLRTENEEQRAAGEKAVAELTNALGQKNSELLSIINREAPKVTEGPDGSVVAAEGGVVFVDRGRKHMLMPGTTFTVLKRVKGGGLVEIGHIKVTSCDAETARAAVLDATDVISEGDLIQSAVYSPNEKLHFVLVGEFSKMGRSSAIARLEQLGAAVDDTVTSKTHYLVVGTPGPGGEAIESSEAYQAAKALNIRMLTEADLSTFTQY